MISIGYLNDGIKISFETRGVDKETADFLWNQLSPSKIEEYAKETGHNLVVFTTGKKEMAVYIEYGETKHLHQKIYNVRCGCGIDEE